VRQVNRVPIRNNNSVAGLIDRVRNIAPGKYLLDNCGSLTHPLRQAPQAGRRCMILEQILREKGSEVYSVAESATLKEAADLLDSRRVGAMVILGESGAIIGVFSERDLVRAIAKMGAAALKSTVADPMSRHVVTAKPCDTIEETMARMTDRRIRHLPVVDGARLTGVVSIGDLVKWRIAEASAEVEAIRSYIQP
jgi:CBS domain-containing protein